MKTAILSIISLISLTSLSYSSIVVVGRTNTIGRETLFSDLPRYNSITSNSLTDPFDATISDSSDLASFYIHQNSTVSEFEFTLETAISALHTEFAEPFTGSDVVSMMEIYFYLTEPYTVNVSVTGLGGSVFINYIGEITDSLEFQFDPEFGNYGLSADNPARLSYYISGALEGANDSFNASGGFTLTASTVPEPGTWFLAALGIAFTALYHRKRRHASPARG